MKSYRYYVSPGTKLPIAAGICALLLGCNTIYTLTAMPHYTQYIDYWITMIAGFGLGLFCLLSIRRRTELVLIPAGALALVACLAPSFVHWTEVILFFLLLLLLLLRLPRWAVTPFRIASVITFILGTLAVLSPMLQRIIRLSESGHATASYLVPFVIRTLGGDVLCLLAMVFLIFSMRPHILPGWMDANDKYDRIWE